MEKPWCARPDCQSTWSISGLCMLRNRLQKFWARPLWPTCPRASTRKVVTSELDQKKTNHPGSANFCVCITHRGHLSSTLIHLMIHSAIQHPKPQRYRVYATSKHRQALYRYASMKLDRFSSIRQVKRTRYKLAITLQSIHSVIMIIHCNYVYLRARSPSPFP